MFCVRHILALLNVITVLLGVLHDVLSCLVGAHESAELVVSSRIGLAREIDVLLHDSSHILVDHILAVKHLNNEATLSEVDLLDLVNTHGVESLNIVLCVLIHRRSRLILACCHPCLLASLTIFLCNNLKVGTTLKSCVNRVGCLLGSSGINTGDLDHAILYRVGQLLLRHELNDVKSVVHLVGHNSCCATHSHRVETASHVIRISILAHGHAEVRNERSAL